MLAGGESILTVHRPKGAIFELGEDWQWHQRCSTTLKIPGLGGMVDDQTVASVDRDGVFRKIDLHKGEQLTTQLDNSTCSAMGLHALGYDGNGTLYYGHFINQRFGQIDTNNRRGASIWA